MNFMSHFRKLFTHFRYVTVIRFNEPLAGVFLSQRSDQMGVEKKCASQMIEPRQSTGGDFAWRENVGELNH
jgi:hypothetical protein